MTLAVALQRSPEPEKEMEFLIKINFLIYLLFLQFDVPMFWELGEAYLLCQVTLFQRLSLLEITIIE